MKYNIFVYFIYLILPKKSILQYTKNPLVIIKIYQ